MYSLLKAIPIKQAVTKKAEGITIRFLAAIILFALIFCAFYFIADEIVLESENNFDVYIYKLLKPVTNNLTTKLMTWVTFFGSSYFLFPSYILLVAYYLFIRKQLKLALDIAIVGLMGNQLLDLIQYIFHRRRPLDPIINNVTGYSFPSGHSFASFTFFGLVTYITWQTQLPKVYKIILSVIFFLIASLIAISRVYLHVHYASDVLGGFCLSIMWLLLSLWLLHEIGKKFFRNQNRRNIQKTNAPKN